MFIMVISAIPGQVFERYEIWNADKLVHSGIYFFLTILMISGFKKRFHYGFFFTRTGLVSFVLATLYGGLIEILQANCFINRSGNWPDFTANMLGALLAWALYSRLTEIRIIKRFL
jgi:VanZ family protein